MLSHIQQFKNIKNQPVGNVCPTKTEKSGKDEDK